MAKTWRLLRVLCLSAFALLVACIAVIWMNVRSDRVIKQWHQPKEVDYKSFDPYTVSAIEGAIDWTPLGFPRRHYLFIGHGKEAPSYGVYLDYTFQPGAEEVDDYISSSTVEWTPEGLTFVEVSGNRLFIPKANFIGGR